MPYEKDAYLYFWKPDEKLAGWASQWYASEFSETIKMEGGNEEVVVFPSAEHWMMVQKALLFNDYEMAREIIAVRGTTGKDMAHVKALGRKVDNFDEETWKAHRERIVLEGSLHKFGQNEELREKLMATGNRILVEASPRDRIWGIGYGEKNAGNKRDSWGLNLLGKALVEARDILK